MKFTEWYEKEYGVKPFDKEKNLTGIEEQLEFRHQIQLDKVKYEQFSKETANKIVFDY